VISATCPGSLKFPDVLPGRMGVVGLQSVKDALKSIAEVAESRGLEVELDENKLVLTINHKDIPLTAVFEPVGDGFRVAIRAGDGLRERIDELLDEGYDPREAVEEALDTLIEVVDRGIVLLEGSGVGVKRDTRGGILDVYDAIESFVEEA